MKVGGLLLIMLMTCTIFFVIGGFCWEYTINTWLEYNDSVNRIEFWQAGLLGFCPIVGQLSIPAAVITLVLQLFL